MRHLTVVPGKLYLVEQLVEKPVQSKAVPSTLNHIFELDGSGSMYNVFDSLCKDLVTKVKELPTGDTVSIGWFSGEGQRNWVLKGFRITDAKDYTVLEKALLNLRPAFCTTCFSEILHDTDQVIQDLSVISENFTFSLFTDGYPVVSNYNREIESIFSAIAKIQGRVASALLVGYGDYYNKELMADMAVKFGGSLIHSSNLPQFSLSLSTFLEEAREVTGQKVKVALKTPLQKPPVAVFSPNGKMINTYDVSSSGEVEFVVSKKAKDFVYVLADTVPAESKEVALTDTNVRGSSSSTESIVKAAYAAAYILTQRTKVDQALEVLGLLGDKALIDAVTNSYTNEEYGNAESKIQESMAAPSKRFSAGRDSNYLPPTNAFCLLDALDLLGGSYFYPTHPQFEYKRIGRAADTVEGYSKFVADASNRTPIGALVWNESKLNLSVLSSIEGTVELLPRENKTAKDFGLVDNYPTKVYRNYALVKDGFLNVQKLPVSVTEEVFDKLKGVGLIDPLERYQQDAIYMAHLDRVPIVNRAIAEGRTSATNLCRAFMKELELKSELKALRWLRLKVVKEEEAAKQKKPTFGEQQKKFLLANGVDPEKGTYSPPRKEVKTDDFYMAKTFEIKTKGLSTSPRVEDVVTKLGVGKPLTASEQLVAAGIKRVEAGLKPEVTAEVKRVWFDSLITDLENQLKKERRYIQETKFAILLGKRWFDEFSSRSETKLTVDGREFTIELGEEKIPV